MPYLTCINHPDLRWRCKVQAITNGRYNGERHLFYIGTTDDLETWSASVPECTCPTTDLRVVPEEGENK